MRKGIATIVKKVRAIKEASDWELGYFNGSWFVRSGLTLGDLRELTADVTAKPVLATARKKKAGKK